MDSRIRTTGGWLNSCSLETHEDEGRALHKFPGGFPGKDIALLYTEAEDLGGRSGGEIYCLEIDPEGIRGNGRLEIVDKVFLVSHRPPAC